MKLLKIVFLSLFIFQCSTNPFQKGEDLYINHCSNCHGKEGEGLRKLYPPINNELYSQYQNKIICAIKYGINDSLKYKGVTYTAGMPSNELLTDIDIVNIVNFLNWKYTSEKEYNGLPEVKKTLADCN